MATFTKRGNTWRAQVCRNGTRISGSFKSSIEAKAWAAKTEAGLTAEDLGAIPDKTFEDLLERYLQEVSPTHKGAHWEKMRIGLLRRDELAQVPLKDLDSRAVAGWRDRRLEAVTSGSVRREWNLLASACNIAVREWRWLRSNPFAGVRRPIAPQHRNRLATGVEIATLRAVATSPVQEQVMQAALFAIETGMRGGEIVNLTGPDVAGKVAKLEETKNGTRREVPLSTEAIRIWEEAGGDGFGLTSRTRDVQWRGLCRKAGIENLHFHDLRHTAITQLAKKLQVLDLARMVGIRDLKILMVYYNESAADIALRL